MSNYDAIAKFYDAAMGDRTRTIERLLALIGKHRPDAKSVLELGCGTGRLLQGLAQQYDVVGVDSSREMLAIAAAQEPDADLYLGDITAFDLELTFDVVVCAFDTINHIPLVDWPKVFNRAAKHLNEDGLFVFDVNTVGKLVAMTGKTHVQKFGDNYLHIDVKQMDPNTFAWDIRILEKLDGNAFTQHCTTITEYARPIRQIRPRLCDQFRILDVLDADGGEPLDNSRRVYFVVAKNG